MMQKGKREVREDNDAEQETKLRGREDIIIQNDKYNGKIRILAKWQHN